MPAFIIDFESIFMLCTAVSEHYASVGQACPLTAWLRLTFPEFAFGYKLTAAPPWHNYLLRGCLRVQAGLGEGCGAREASHPVWEQTEQAGQRA